MQSLLITPKDEAEFGLLSALLERMHIAATVIADDDKEDIGMGILVLRQFGGIFARNRVEG